jgi:hypothetical protein
MARRRKLNRGKVAETISRTDRAAITLATEVSNHGFRSPAAGDQLRTDVYRTWSWADACRRGGLGRPGSRIEFDGSVLRIDGLQLDWRDVARSIV